MAALLTRQRMDCKGDGRFHASRPFQILRFEIKPEVVAARGRIVEGLEIAFEDCRIHGLGSTNAIRWSMALLPPKGGVEAQAQAAIWLSSDSPAVALPSGCVDAWRPGLATVFARLERRCQGLRRLAGLDCEGCLQVRWSLLNLRVKIIECFIEMSNTQAGFLETTSRSLISGCRSELSYFETNLSSEQIRDPFGALGFCFNPGIDIDLGFKDIHE